MGSGPVGKVRKALLFLRIIVERTQQKSVRVSFREEWFCCALAQQHVAAREVTMQQVLTVQRGQRRDENVGSGPLQQVSKFCFHSSDK